MDILNGSPSLYFLKDRINEYFDEKSKDIRFSALARIKNFVLDLQKTSNIKEDQ